MILSVPVFDQYDLVLNNSAYYNFLLFTIINNNLFMLLLGPTISELKISNNLKRMQNFLATSLKLS